MISSHLNECIKFRKGSHKIIPITWCPTAYYNISFDGWKEIRLEANDNKLNTLIRMAAASIKEFIKSHRSTHAFTEPNFYYRSQECSFGVKIGTMEMQLYKELYKGQKKKKEKSHPL